LGERKNNGQKKREESKIPIKRCKELGPIAIRRKGKGKGCISFPMAASSSLQSFAKKSFDGTI
jgi:hypothetical protein